jgi:hypothetical protein
VHLVHAELHDTLWDQGYAVSAGQMGENVTTRGVDLLRLPTGARLHLGDVAVVEVTGLRNPCAQLDRIQPGLMGATLKRAPDGNLIRKAGIMAVMLEGGDVRRATRSGSSCRLTRFGRWCRFDGRYRGRARHARPRRRATGALPAPAAAGEAEQRQLTVMSFD